MFIAGLVKRYGRGSAPLINSYRDIEEKSGKAIREMLERQPENFLLPEKIAITINNTLTDLNTHLTRFLESLENLIPLGEIEDKR